VADIQSFLTKKAGPLPVWGWAAAGGGLISVLWLARRGQASSSAAGTAAAGQPNVPYVPSPIIVTPGNMPSGTSSMNPNPVPPSSAPPPNPLWQYGAPPNHRAWVYHVTPTGSANSGGKLVAGQVYPALGPGWAGAESHFQEVAGGWGWQWAPVPSGTDSSGTPWTPQSYAQALSAAGMGGGSSSVMNFVPGSGGGKILRHSGPHAHPQYVGMGGGGNSGSSGGHSALRTVSQRTRVPMTRLMSLNPGHWHPRKQRPTTIHIA
jgi:hypothetical protein